MEYTVAESQDAAKLVALSISDLAAASEVTSPREYPWAQTSKAPDVTPLVIEHWQHDTVSSNEVE
jgi:hypothetical protein